MKHIQCFAIALVALVSGCNKDQPKNITPSSATSASASASLKPMELLIDWQAEPTYLGIYYAKSIGAFKDIGLDIKIIQSWGANDAAIAVAGGKYAIGTASGAATAIARSNGAKLLSTAVIYHQLPTAVYGLADSGIKTPKDLQNKTVGIYPKSITKNEFEAFLKINGIDGKSIRIESISGPDLPLILSKKVDAVLNYFELSPTQLAMDKDTFQFMLNDHGVKSYGLNIITSENAYKNNPTEINGITQAMIKGYEQGCANQEIATTAFLKEFPEKDPKYVKLSWAKVCKFINGDYKSQTVAGWQETIDLYAKQGLLKATVTPQEIIAAEQK